MLIWCPGLSDASTFKCKLQNLEGLQAKWATVGICFIGPTFWCYKSQPSYFQNQKSEWWSWSWCSKGLFKGYKNLLGCVQYLTLIFFPIHEWVVEQIKKKKKKSFVSVFQLWWSWWPCWSIKTSRLWEVMTPDSGWKYQDHNCSGHWFHHIWLCILLQLQTFKTSALSWGKDMLCCDRPCYGFTCGWVSDTASLLKSPPLKLRAIYDWCVVQN